MAEIGNDFPVNYSFENVPHLSPEEKAAAKPLENKAWAKSMEILGNNRDSCTEKYGANKINELNISDTERTEGLKFLKREGIDLYIELIKGGSPVQEYYFEKKDGKTRVIKRISNISGDIGSEDVHEANKEELEELVNILQGIKKT